jgi:hypothetical protein
MTVDNVKFAKNMYMEDTDAEDESRAGAGAFFDEWLKYEEAKENED